MVNLAILLWKLDDPQLVVAANPSLCLQDHQSLLPDLAFESVGAQLLPSQEVDLARREARGATKSVHDGVPGNATIAQVMLKTVTMRHVVEALFNASDQLFLQRRASLGGSELREKA